MVKLRRIFTDTRGSAAVLIVILFAGLIGLTAVIFQASKITAGRSCADAASRLAGRSVLSEYDLRLLGDYGILAFKGDEEQIEKDLTFYTDVTLRKGAAGYEQFLPQRAGLNLVNINMDYAANLKQFSLMDTGIFEEQLERAAPKIIAETSAELSGGNEEVGFGDTNGEPDYNRTLRNNSVKAALPSSAYVSSDSAKIPLTNIQLLGDIFNASAAKVNTDEYILSVFGNANDDVYSEERFFANETEYIISGDYNDGANYTNVKNTIADIRTIMNNLSLLADDERRTEARELSVAFAEAEEIDEELAFEAIIERWVVAETRNDIMLLEKGEKVAFSKTEEQWATSNIEKIIDGYVASKPVSAKDKAGDSYRDYLRGLLYLTDRDVKLLRVMDLMQINMKTGYDRDFLIREYYTGFRFSGEVGGNELSYTERS
jgi:hypothetical protein